MARCDGSSARRRLGRRVVEPPESATEKRPLASTDRAQRAANSEAACLARAPASSNTTIRPTSRIRESAAGIRAAGPAPLLDVLEEADEVPEVSLLVVPHGEVAAVLADRHPRSRDEPPHLADVFRVHLVVPGADQERRHLNLRQVLPAVPVLEGA